MFLFQDFAKFTPICDNKTENFYYLLCNLYHDEADTGNSLYCG